MTFALPHLLWLGLVPVALLVWEITRRRHDAATTHPHILRAEAGNHRLKLAAAAAGATRRHRVRPWLCAGLLLSVVALARPQWGRVDEPVFDQAREILIAIDLSRSMLTPDVRPSRLDRAKLLVQSLLEKLNGERIGLVVFSGTAFLQSPLSADYEILREFLPALNPEFLPEGGTNYRALIDTALSAFGTSGSADRFLIVLSDGEATEENWRERLPELKTKGIRVLGLGVGTAEGAMIPDGSGGFVKDERGAVVLSKLEPATLRELAETTNGVYQDASAWIDLAALIDSTIATGQKGEFLEKNSVRLVERFQWPLALGLWCLLVSLYYEFPVRPRPRQLTLSPANEPTRDPPPLSAVPPSTPAPSITTVAILLLLVPATLLPVRSAHAAEKAAPPAESAPLARIVTRLATTPQRTARDWAEFARETVTWGTRLQSSQQAVPEGPVRDALAAVELGSKQDPKTTDWPKLRQELEALLKKPDDQQQQQQQQQNQQDQ
ncbi:MAG TPA: VWA domain-containing protein, partial [Opitutus sp.]|nr:VWA domain-containing protein [Opitutus sp.]